MSTSGLQYIDPPSPDPRVLAARVVATITVDDMKDMIARLQRIADRDQKAWLLLDLQHYRGYEIGVILEKLKHLRLLWHSIERYAVVGAAGWMEQWVKIAAPWTRPEMKTFTEQETKQAWDWLLTGNTNSQLEDPSPQQPS